MVKKRLFQNILALCMALAVIYMAVICVIWLGNEASKNRQSAVGRSRQLLLGAKTEIDKRLVMAASVLEQLSREQEISSFMRSEERDAYTTLQIRDRISNVTNNFSQLGFRIDIFNRHQDLVVTGKKAQSLEDYLRETGAEPELYGEVLEQLQRYGSRSRFVAYPKTVISETTGTQQLLMLYKSHVDAREDLIFFVILDKNYLLSDYTITGGEQFCLTCRGEPLLMFQNSTASMPAITAELIASSGGMDAPRPVNQDNQVYYGVRSSAVEELGYFLVVPQDSLLEHNFGAILLIMTATLLALLAGFVLIYFAVRRIYRPVGTVVEEIRAHSGAEGRDEMQMIRNTFTTIRSQLEEDQVFLREKLLKDLLYGIAVEGKLDDLIRQYDLEYLHGDVSVTVVEYVEVEHLKGFSGKNDLVTVKKEILEYLRGDLRFTRFELFQISEPQFVIITAGYSLDEVRKRVSDVINVVEACYDIKLLGATGSLSRDLSGILDSFYDALNMLGYKTLFSARNVVTVKNMEQMNTYYYPLELEKNLIAYVQQGKRDKAAALLNNIMEKNRSLALDSYNIMELKFAMVATVKRLVQLFGRRTEELFDKHEFEQWQFSAEGLDELRQQMDGYIGRLCAVADTTCARESSAALQNLLDYLHENYSRDISLGEAADYYQISQGYVGKLFREQMHTTFKDYLNQYRVSVAKKMLVEHPTMKISEIARQVGFINAVTFNRVFKKYETVTPGDYRSNNL